MVPNKRIKATKGNVSYWFSFVCSIKFCIKIKLCACKPFAALYAGRYPFLSFSNIFFPFSLSGFNSKDFS